MHRDVTLVAIKSSNKLKYLKLEERKLKTAKEVVIQVVMYLQNCRHVPRQACQAWTPRIVDVSRGLAVIR